jgi:DNA-binding CsgD family transcriptional regulator
MFKKNEFDEKKMVELYVTSTKNTAEIGRILGVDPKTIRKRLKEKGLYIPKPVPDKNKIIELYIDEELTLKEVAALAKTSAKTVISTIVRAGYKTRSQAEAWEIKKERNEQWNPGRKKVEIDPEILKQMHVDKKMRPKQIANIIGVSHRTITSRLKEAGIYQPYIVSKKKRITKTEFLTNFLKEKGQLEEFEKQFKKTFNQKPSLNGYRLKGESK